MFRIISGTHKGRRILAPKNLSVRPTTDFAKEALFGILSHKVNFPKIRVLDLFGGIGSISYEFASRGVADISLVEQEKAHTKFIYDTLAHLNFKSQFSIYTQEVFSWLAKNKEKFDVIFADPPYDLPIEKYTKLLSVVLDNDHLEDGGMFILEHSSKQKPIEHPDYQYTRKYGNVSFSFYEKLPDS